jgi:protein involved in polysaccharide export with SLBB domain/uncharacterized protein involved in exopolysaccharide biosynthesis
MSEEYTHVGTVRRRPRTGHQRSQYSSANGEARTNGNGSYAKNGRDTRPEFEPDADFSAAAEEPAREPRRPRPRFDAPKKERKPRPSSYGSEMEEEPLFRFPFDPWRLYGAAKRNLGWIFAAGVFLAIVGFFVALMLVQYKVNLLLIRTTSNTVRNENAPVVSFTPREYSEQTLYSFMKSSEVLNRVVAKASTNAMLAPLNATPQILAEAISIKPTPNPDYVQLSMEAFGNLPAMVELVNIYGAEVTEFTKEIQQREAKAINQLLQEQVAQVNEKLRVLTGELRQFSESGFVDYGKESESEVVNLVKLRDELQTRRMELETVKTKIQALGGSSVGPTTRLEQAREELKGLLLTMKPAHPTVQKKQAEIKQLESLPNGGGTAAGSGAGTNPLMLSMLELQAQQPALERRIVQIQNTLKDAEERLNTSGRVTKDVEFEIKLAEKKQMDKSLDVLQNKERESREFIEGSRGYFAVTSPATTGNIGVKNRWIKVSLLTLFAGMVGFFVALGIVMLTEMLDTTIRTSEDITRITRLPVLATLGDLRKMSAAQQVNWAFRTLTLLKGKLSRDADQALVCGIISANHGEGRSTWVNLLVSAASQRGLRVLTVDTKATAAAPAAAPAEPVKSEKRSAEAATGKPGETANGQPINLPDHEEHETVNGEHNMLSTPGKVAEQLNDPNCQALVHIPLPGWVWSLERRKQWQKALESWKDIDNLVIFVELPPACEQESVLLAEHLPQCLWLTGSGMADSAETAAHIETLRHARCNLVGAVLNHAPPPFLSNKITRWFNKPAVTALLLGSLLTSGINAQAQPAAASGAQFAAGQEDQQEAPRTFSATARRKRANWQEKLTLGPGDVVDIHFYGNAALSRTNVFIGPDGRITYLQANGLTAAGLSIEELRQKLDEQLSDFYTSPRTMVIPVAFNSKKYFMLGKVNAKGAYPLDRPLTLLEAVARAKGLETGLYQRTTVEMADLGRSFIVRGNEKLDVDFSRLFLEGDLSQNISIEPNDYIFFASTGANDIYVLGEVMLPGPLGFISDATVMTAITDRGGYSEKAYKKRVLVVRGSLSEPETFVVDSGGTLDGRLQDFRLESGDIVYVSRRPWVKAEELLDEAASSFIQGAVTTWAGVNVGPIITKRLLPRARPTQ